MVGLVPSDAFRISPNFRRPPLPAANLARLAVFLEARIAACLAIIRALLIVPNIGIGIQPIAGLRPRNADGSGLSL